VSGIVFKSIQNTTAHTTAYYIGKPT